MKRCEYCGNQHDGSYGSGRFCSKFCASGFSTKAKRQEINRALSLKMKGKPPIGGRSFKKGYDPRRHIFTDEERVEAIRAHRQKLSKRYERLPWMKLPKAEKRRRILREQNRACLICKLNEWLGEPLTLEFDHIDGNKLNEDRENLRLICPNCHTLTPNYKGKNIKKYRVEVGPVA